MKLVGPNSLGMLNTRIGLYSTFSSYFDPLWPRIGPVGIVSQSGAFGTYFLAIAAERGLGFSHCVATGNEADVDVAECVDWLADDPDTGVIMIYLEGCRDGARLRAALARAAANRKPVVAMKVGVSEQGVAAVASHTGSLVGSDAVFDAVFREYNVHRARSIDELVDVAYACSGGVFPKTPRVGVVTISGGVGIQMADAAAELDLELPCMPDAAQQKILAMVPFAGPANPVDATAQVINDWSMFTTILNIVADEGNVDSVISFLAHTGTSPGVMEKLKPALKEVTGPLPGSRVHAVRAAAAGDGGRVLWNRVSHVRGSDARHRGRGRAFAAGAGVCQATCDCGRYSGRTGTASRTDQRGGCEAIARGSWYSVRARARRADTRRGGRSGQSDWLSPSC